MSDVYDGYTKIKTPEGTILKVGYKGAPPSAADLQDVINQYDILPGAQKSFATGADKPDPNDPFVGPRLAPQKPLAAQEPNTPQFFKNVGRNAKQIISDVGGYGSNLLNTAVQSAGIDEADLPANASRVAQPIKTFVKANAAIAPRAAKIQTIIARMHQIADRGTPEAAKEYAGHVAQLKAMGVPASAYGATTPQQDSAATMDLAKQAGNFAYNNPIDAGMIALGGLGETAEGIGSAARIAEAMNAGSKAGEVAKIADTVARLSHGAATGGVSEIVRAARGGAAAEEAANAASVSRALEPPTSLPESPTTTGLQAAKASKPIIPPPAETAANPLQALATAEAGIPKPVIKKTPVKLAPARPKATKALSPEPVAVTITSGLDDIHASRVRTAPTNDPFLQKVNGITQKLKASGVDTSGIEKAVNDFPEKPLNLNDDRMTGYHKSAQDNVIQEIRKVAASQIRNVPAASIADWQTELASVDQPDNTPTVRHNDNAIDAAETGQPLTVTGFRQNRGPGVGGTGRFYATDPLTAGEYGGEDPSSNFLKNGLQGGNKSTMEVQRIEAKNPLVVQGGQTKLLDALDEHGVTLTDQERSLLSSAVGTIKKSKAVGQEGHGYPILDKLANNILHDKGFDAIVYRKGNGNEIAKLETPSTPYGTNKLSPVEVQIATDKLSNIEKQLKSEEADPLNARDIIDHGSRSLAASEGEAGSSARGNSEPANAEVQPASKPSAPRRTRSPKSAVTTAQSETGQVAPGSTSGESKPAPAEVTTGTQNEPVLRTGAKTPVKVPGSPVQAGKAIKLPITQNEAFTVQDSLSPELRGKLSAALKSKGVASVDLTPSEVEEVRAANAGTKYPSDPDVKSLRTKLMEMKGAAPERGTRLATEPPKMAGGAPNSDPFRGLKAAIAKAKNVTPAAKQSLFSDAVQESIDNTKAVTGNFFNRRFSRTMKESPETYEAVRNMAGAKGQAHVSALTSLPQISEAMNRGTAGIKQFNSLMVENRLRGIRKMWQEAATSVQGIDPTAAGIGKSYAKDLRNMVANAGDRSGVTGALKDADALAKAKDYQGLKDHLKNVFASSASSVPAVHLGPRADAFEAETARPEFQKALKIYQDQMEGPMKESHLSNGGVISGHLGPLDTYYPLVAEEANQKGATKLASGSVTAGNSPEPIGLRGRTGSTAPEFKAPLNRHNQFATGLADRYSVDPKHLLTEMARSYRTNSRANLINVARSEGILTDLPKGVQTGPDQITYKGRQVPATTVMTKAPLTIAMKGKTFTKPGAYAVMPTSLYREMHEMLDPSFVPKDDANIGRNVVGFLNGIAVKGFAEPVFHGTNVLGTLVNNTPFVGLGEATIGGKPIPKVLDNINRILGPKNNFFTKGANAVYNLGKIKTDTPEFAKDMMRLAKMGLVPTRTGEITTSARYAAITGAKHSPVLGALSAALFGPSGLDTRARVLMLRIADQAAPLASEAEKAKFVEQLGIYNHELEAKLTTGAKYTGLGPFATAGVQMNKNAVTGFFGRSPLPRGGNTTTRHVMNRIGQLSASGLGGVASWMVTHKAVTGKWPWQDKNARPMAIPVPNSVKNSAVGKQLWKGTGTAYVSMDIFNPLVSRALRTTGLGPAALAAMLAPRGSKFGIASEEAIKSVVNSNAHPYISGTATRAAFNMFGVEPSLTGVRDSMTGRPGPQFFPSSDTKQPGIPQLKENLKETLLNLNPSVGNAAEDMGFGRQQGKAAGGHGRQIGKAIADIVAPRSVSGTYDANEASGRYDKMIQRIKAKEGRGIKLAPGGLNAIK